MSDEEDESISEGFSASEDEWKPEKSNAKHGESSDDDDSDFEESTIAGAGSAKSHGSSRKRETKNLLKNTGGVAKKRKPMGQSLRSRLYNKYRPPPKTFQHGDSPRASTSSTASKNARTPNEVSGYGDNNDNEDDDGSSSSDSSVGNHLVNPADLDLRSSFFNVDGKDNGAKAPVFDCNAGISYLSDSDNTEEEQQHDGEASGDEGTASKAFDFRNLLEKANSLERMKEQIAKKSNAKSSKSKNPTMDDVTTLLALGENQHLGGKTMNRDLGTDEDDEDDDADDDARKPSKLNKTKSTRIKKHKKTRPTSAVLKSGGGAGDGDSDDSDWEEVADDDQEQQEPTYNQDGLEIFVEPNSRKRSKEAKTQEELEMAFRRRLNRDIKDLQLLLHKGSLLCLFGRSYQYNRLINDTNLMQAVLKLLPGSNAYPKAAGTELKYFQSFVTWFNTVIQLNSPNLYPEKKKVGMTNTARKEELIDQIKSKQACCKQDMIIIFIALLRAMGIQCRLVVNMQPLPLKPSQQDLLPIKMKPENKQITNESKPTTSTKKSTNEIQQKSKSKDTKENEKGKDKDIGKHKETKSEKARTDVTLKKEKGNREETLNNKDENKQESNSKEAHPKKRKEKKTLLERLERNLATEDGEFFPKQKEMYRRETRSERDRKANSNETKTKTETKTQTETTAKKKKKKKESILEKLERHKAIMTAAENNDQVDKNKTTITDQEKEKDHQTNDKQKDEPQIILPGNSISSRPKRGCTATTNEIIPSKKAKSEQMKTSGVTAPTITVDPASTDSGICIDEGNILPKADIKLKSFVCASVMRATRSRSRSKSPRSVISTDFLETTAYKEKFSPDPKDEKKAKQNSTKTKQKVKEAKPRISTEFLKSSSHTIATGRLLRSQQNLASNVANDNDEHKIPQLDGADDAVLKRKTSKGDRNVRTNAKKKFEKSLSRTSEDSDEDFQPSEPKQPKRAPVLPKAVSQLRKDRRVLSTDQDTADESKSHSKSKKETAADIWAEVWSDIENEWICIDVFKGKLRSVDSIRKSASSHMAYVYAFQNDLSIKDVTARYCQNWSSVMRKDRVPKAWLEIAISPYYGQRTERDVREDHELRRIHEEKEMPKSIAEFKDHPLYALERHLLKFQSIYPPNAPTFGFTSRGEPIYSRDCVHVLHSREIWLKQARTVKLGEKPYKIVKARPKWDRLTQSVIKDQPLEIFGYWQTEDYEPPTAENGIVPRNAYGNVELFKECMLPKKTVHIKLPGLNRICKKLGIDCANAVIGFDFHQGSCHPTYDGFVVCEEFADQVTAAWYQDQEDQEQKEREKFEARVYGNWKKLIRGLLIRERLKKKYNF